MRSVALVVRSSGRRPLTPGPRPVRGRRWLALAGRGALALVTSGCAGRSAGEPAAELPTHAAQAGDPSPASVAELCEPELVRRWEDASGAVSRGTCLGKEIVGYHFVSQHQRAGDADPSWEFHLWLGKDGGPRQAQLRVPTMVRRFYWTPEGLVTSIFGDTEAIDAPEDAWVMPELAPYLWELRMRLDAEGGPNGAALPYVIAETGIARPGELRPVAEGGEGSLRIADELVSFELRGRDRAALELRSMAFGGGLSPAATMSATAADALLPHLPEIPRPTYRLPADLEVEPFAVSGVPKLAGELVRARDRSPGRAPGVVFLSGSGPQDRHGFVPGTSIDAGSHELHDALARAGFTVLRFDDRGVGASERGDTATPGYQDFVDDARRAVAALAAHPEVDDRKIVVVGHSEGALTASILARERFGPRKRRLAGAVLMAGTGRSLRDVIYSQIRATTEDPEAAERMVSEARKIHDAVMRDGELPAATEPIRDYLKQIFAVDPVANLDRVDVPVFLAQGGKDFQVDPELDFEPLRDTLEKRRRPHSEARIYEGLDHLFKREPGRSSVGHYGDLRRHVDPQFIADVVTWAAARVGR